MCNSAISQVWTDTVFTGTCRICCNKDMTLQTEPLEPIVVFAAFWLCSISFNFISERAYSKPSRFQPEADT